MLRVKDVMTKNVFSMDVGQNLAEVRFLMKAKHIRHVPIVDSDGCFLGLMTHRDLLAQTVSMLADIDEDEQYNLDRNILIQHVMKKDVVTADPDLKLDEAAKILLEHKYGCLPVVVNDKIVGIVTEADFLKLTLDLLAKNEERT